MSAPIFISFASNDRKAAETICTALEKRGLGCWIATRNIGPGENFQESITRAIRTAKVMILVFSANANNSLEVKKEIALAGRYNVVVVPVRVEDVVPNDALSYELAVRQWIDLFDDWEHAIENLATQVKALVNAAADPAAAAEPSAQPAAPARPDRAPPATRRGLVGAVAGGIAALALIGGGVAWQFWPTAHSTRSSPLAETRVAQEPPTEGQSPAAAARPASPPPAAEPPIAAAPPAPVAQPAPQTPPVASSPAASPPVAKAFIAGQTFRDCANCPEMVVLPAGRFMMGGDAGELEQVGVPLAAAMHAQPRHEVAFAKPFAIGKFDVTRAAFAAFVSATNFAVHPCAALTGNGWVHQEELNWERPGFAQTDRDPVVCVNANDTDAFLGWLRSTTGHPYRLPTDAEWEYAARGGTVTAYYWGDDPNQVCLYENVADETFKEQNRAVRQVAPCRDGFVETAPVGSFKPNPFGLYDMLGNVFVMTEDCWNETYAGAPTDGSAWKTGDCSRRAARKASFGTGRSFTYRADHRVPDFPGPRRNRWGFRVALSLP